MLCPCVCDRGVAGLLMFRSGRLLCSASSSLPCPARRCLLHRLLSANVPCSAASQGTLQATSPAAQTPKPSGKENWTVAKDLPAHQVMRIAFSASEPARGYASVFIGKQTLTDNETQALYATTDSGVSWSQAGTVEAPEGDIISVRSARPARCRDADGVCANAGSVHVPANARWWAHLVAANGGPAHHRRDCHHRLHRMVRLDLPGGLPARSLPSRDPQP